MRYLIIIISVFVFSCAGPTGPIGEKGALGEQGLSGELGEPGEDGKTTVDTVYIAAEFSTYNYSGIGNAEVLFPGYLDGHNIAITWWWRDNPNEWRSDASSSIVDRPRGRTLYHGQSFQPETEWICIITDFGIIQDE